MATLTRAMGNCALCLNDGPLCRSHLLPAASYKPLRSVHRTNPHPLIVTPERAYTTSKQPADYLLCPKCEERFHHQGEDWVLSHSYRGGSHGFKFRDILLRQSPVFQEGDSRIHTCATIADLAMEKVIYFAASVFWRSAVHTWRRDERIIHIELGKYEEPLRLFLLGVAPFPARMALHTSISSLEGDLLAVCHVTEENRIDGLRTYQFAIPGMVFQLIVSGHLPDRYLTYSTAPALERFVAIVPSLDKREVSEMARRLHRVRQRVTS